MLICEFSFKVKQPQVTEITHVLPVSAVNFDFLRYFIKLGNVNVPYGGMQWRSWLRHCATIRKVTGSIPDGVIGIFH